MTTQYITEYVNEYGQVNTYEALEAIRRAMKLRTYATASKMIEELENLFNGEDYDNVNGDLFFLTFDEEADLRRYSKQIEAKQAQRQEARRDHFAELQEATNEGAYNHKGEHITAYGTDFFTGYYVEGKDSTGARFYRTARTLTELCELVYISHTALKRDVMRKDYR